MDRYGFVDHLRAGVLVQLHGRSGGVWGADSFIVESFEEAERRLARWVRRWDRASAVLLEGDVRLAEGVWK